MIFLSNLKANQRNLKKISKVIKQENYQTKQKNYQAIQKKQLKNVKGQRILQQIIENLLRTIFRLSYVNNFEQLDDKKINEFFNTNFQQVKYYQKLLPLDIIKQQLIIIKQQLYSIESIINDYQENKNDYSNSIIDQKNRKYITQVIDQTYYYYYGSSISKNEQYLAYGGGDKKLKIYDIKQKKIIKDIKLDNYLNVCQFTQDSSQLYVGLDGGLACGYDVQDDFKKIFKQQIHSSSIYNMSTIQNEYLITCSQDKTIIKTDIKSKQQIFKLSGHTDRIYAIAYNNKNEIIVSGSDDKSIKLWNCRNQSIMINKEQSHQIRQIQLINNNLNILSLDQDGNIYKWQIDLTNKDLIKLQQFSDQNKILNFYQFNQDQNLLLLYNNYAKILDQQGETINKINHGCQSNSCYMDCRQLDNLNYIQIRAQDKIILATAQNQISI